MLLPVDITETESVSLSEFVRVLRNGSALLLDCFGCSGGKDAGTSLLSELLLFVEVMLLPLRGDEREPEPKPLTRRLFCPSFTGVFIVAGIEEDAILIPSVDLSKLPPPSPTRAYLLHHTMHRITELEY